VNGFIIPRQSEESWLSAMDFTGSFLIFLSLTYKIRHINERAAQWLGYSRQRLKDTALPSVWEQGSSLIPLFQKMSQGSSDEKAHETFNDNNEKSITWFIARQFNEKQKLIGFVLLSRLSSKPLIESHQCLLPDVFPVIDKTKPLLTACLSVEEEVIAVRNYYEPLINDLPGEVYWKNRGGVYLGCNDNYAKRLGLVSQKELIGKKASDFFDTGCGFDFESFERAVMETGLIKSFEAPPSFSKEQMHLFYNIPLKNEKSEVIGLLSMSFDMTKWIQIQKELQQANHQLEQVNQALQEEIRIQMQYIYHT
jgi:hypothetical protein